MICNRVYFGLGSNIENRFEYLNNACKMLEENYPIKIVKKSSIYEADTWGDVEQPDFLNMCIEVETTLGMYEISAISKSIEERLGRTKEMRGAPRTIDIDMLFFNDELVNDYKVSKSSNDIWKMAFVLIPLAELNNKLEIREISIGEWLDLLTLDDKDSVRVYVPKLLPK